jgi:hypothetical protein
MRLMPTREDLLNCVRDTVSSDQRILDLVDTEIDRFIQVYETLDRPHAQDRAYVAVAQLLVKYMRNADEPPVQFTELRTALRVTRENILSTIEGAVDTKARRKKWLIVGGAAALLAVVGGVVAAASSR